MATFRIEGLDKLLEQFENLKGIDREKLGLVGAYTLLAESQKLAPVKTGYLRESGRVEGVSDEGANLIFGAEYAYYVEYGSSKWAGKPFIRPAIDTKGDLIVKNMKDELEKQMKEKIK